MPNSRRILIWGGLLSLAYLIAASLLLPAYGPTWDAVIGDYRYGDLLVAYMTSGSGSFIDFVQSSPELASREPHLDLSMPQAAWFQLYPVANFLAGLSNRILWTEFGWVQDLYAYHLIVLLFVAALIFAVFVFAANRVGSFFALIAVAVLLCSPRFLGHSFNNLKDVPETCLYALTAIAAYSALYRGPNWRLWVGFGALLGLALAQKANAAFLPLQLLLFAGLSACLRLGSLRWTWLSLCLAIGTCLATYFLVSPALWHDPVAAFSMHVGEVLRVGSESSEALAGLGGAQPGRVSLHGASQVLITTPLPFLALALIGIFARRHGRDVRLFCLLWLLVPIGRTILPGMRSFDGVRHFMEFYPALALLAAFGLEACASAASRCLGLEGRSRLITLALTAACFLPPAWQCYQTHPNGICYFNQVTGGLAGAQERGVAQATDYWGNSYWQGLAWLDENAPVGSDLLVPLADHLVKSAAPLRLREDIRRLEEGAEPSGGTLLCMYITRRGAYGPAIDVLETIDPLHSIQVQGGSILKITAATGEKLEEFWTAWQRENRAKKTSGRVANWFLANPHLLDDAQRLFRHQDIEESRKIMARLLEQCPADLQQPLMDLIYLFRPDLVKFH
ncbi:MAG: glycosyltransferase family 39 protein [Planctomycetota bacterium]|jgi:hypothetical protein